MKGHIKRACRTARQMESPRSADVDKSNTVISKIAAIDVENETKLEESVADQNVGDIIN